MKAPYVDTIQNDGSREDEPVSCEADAKDISHRWEDVSPS